MSVKVRATENFVQRNGDMIVALAVIMVVAMMVVPLPWFVVDILLAFNLTLAIMILLVTMYTREPLEFSIFPALLLVATLFRLALNVSCTRLILLEGFAGNLIAAFGEFVVGGNPVVGFIVFLILVIIQFIVITKGSERVAEVAARFTLDAMPGKQMAIDADLNAGLITDADAKKRRRDVEREADFYGAMDGASKFVKGDAIAALVITAINLIGGFAVGMLQQNLDFAQSMARYSLLTVGNGLLAQIPALLISTAAGIIVTRAASEENLGTDVIAQVIEQPRVLKMTAGFVLALVFVPGLPKPPFLVLGVLLAALSLVLSRAAESQSAAMLEKEREEQMEEARRPESVLRLTQVDPIEVELGYSIVFLADSSQGGDLLERIYMIRRQLAADLGMVIPPVRIRDNIAELSPRQYSIKLRGVKLSGGELMPGHHLCMGGPDNASPPGGIQVNEPVFGLKAWWVPEASKESAEVAGFTVVDPASVLATHLSEVLRNHGHEVLSRQDVQQICDLVKESHPAVVDELVPSLLSLGEVQKVLQNLLKEGVPIRDSVTILETLADHARQSRDTDLLTELVRQRLGRQITSQFGLGTASVSVITVDPKVESVVMDASKAGLGSEPALEPEMAHKILRSLAREIEKAQQNASTPVILCSSSVRPQFKRLAERVMPRLTVLSYAELDRSVELEPSGMVSIS